MSESRVLEILQRLEKDKKNKDFQLLDGSIDLSVDRRSSGILSVDVALGGGYPFGRVIEAFGAPSGGKTTLSLHAISSVQKAGGVCAFVDAEHTFDATYAKALGVDISNILLNQPNSGEDALNSVIDLSSVLSPGDLIVIDSVAALTPQAELDGEVGDHHVGLQARMMSQSLRMLVGSLSKSKAIAFFVNQTRDTIGGMGFGPKTTTSGGNALKFYASQRVEVTRIGSVKKGEDIIGNKTKVKIVKNKCAPPFRESQPDLIYGKGFDYKTDVVNLAVAYGVMEKSGSWLKYKDQNVGQGVVNVVDSMPDQLLEELVGRINEITGF